MPSHSGFGRQKETSSPSSSAPTTKYRAPSIIVVSQSKHHILTSHKLGAGDQVWSFVQVGTEFADLVVNWHRRHHAWYCGVPVPKHQPPCCKKHQPPGCVLRHERLRACTTMYIFPLVRCNFVDSSLTQPRDGLPVASRGDTVVPFS